MTTLFTLHTHPFQLQSRAGGGRTCRVSMTSSGSPCNYGGWAEEPPGAPVQPAGAGERKHDKLTLFTWYIHLNKWQDIMIFFCMKRSPRLI